MELPTKKTKEKSDINKFSWLIYGNPGVGKSTFCSYFEDALIIDTQAGHNHIESCSTKIGSWEDFQGICAELSKQSKEGKLAYKTIVLDTVDDLYAFCFSHVCKREGMAHPSDEGYGKGWSLISDEFKRAIFFLMNIANVVFVSHADLKEIKTRLITLNKIVPSLSGASGKFITAIVDIIGYVCFDPEDPQKRVVMTQASDSIEAKDRSGLLPEKIEFNYETVSKILKGDK